MHNRDTIIGYCLKTRKGAGDCPVKPGTGISHAFRQNNKAGFKVSVNRPSAIKILGSYETRCPSSIADLVFPVHEATLDTLIDQSINLSVYYPS